MPNNTENTLASRIEAIKLLTKDFPDKETISDLKLSHLLDIFSYRKEKSRDDLVIFSSLTECIKEKAENKEILLYLFLNTLEKEHAKAGLVKILGNESQNTIEQQINNFSTSELPEPSLYKGWK